MKTALTPPKLTPDWYPSRSRIGLKKIEVETKTTKHFQLQNWYVQDDAEAIANTRFFQAAPAMAEALLRCLPDFEIDESSPDGHSACELSVGDVKAIRSALLAAGYTEEESK